MELLVEINLFLFHDVLDNANIQKKFIRLFRGIVSYKYS
jgi:hypothetical protein